MRDLLIAPLAKGYFAPRGADPAQAAALADGWLEIAGRRVRLDSPDVFDDTGDLPRNHVLALHSLRWLDALRRQRGSVEGAEEAWSRIASLWARSRSAQDTASVAWGVLPLEQRATAIALGAPPTDDMRELLDGHLRELEKVEEQSRSADRRLALLRIRLALQASRGDSPDQLRATAASIVEDVFREDGYAICEDLRALAEVGLPWAELLREIGMEDDDPAVRRVQATDFWTQAMAPDGRLVPIGGRLPETVPGGTDPQQRYVVTGGEEGSAPVSISHVDPEGLVALRSGWGETERDARDETLVTLLLGPVRSREAHHDPGRITFHSQGRPWLIDPVEAAAAGADAHSIVDVEEVRYRLHGGAELIRHYADDRVEGLVVKANVHLAVQWQRHLVLARTGNYVVVEDTVRSSTEHVAHQQWIIAPDVEIEATPRGFLLHADGRTVALVVSTSRLSEHVVDDIRDEKGIVIARRLRIPLIGRSNRAVSIIADVIDRESFSARRVPRGGKEFTVDIRDKQLDETLVVTPEQAMIQPPGLDPEEAVERTIAFAAAGDLDPEEALAQRLSVRRAIEQIKSQVRAGGGDVTARARGIQDLIAAGEELRVRGLRDHGFGAALVDLAGTDLVDRVASHPQVGNLRRSALVRWSDEQLVQPRYGVPVRTTLDAGELPDELDAPSVWSVDLGQLVPSTYLLDGEGDILTVYFHGATDRSKHAMPRYERLRSFATLGLGPVMFFSDPTLDLDSRMILSWYVGTEEVDLHREIARMIQAYATHRGIRKVLIVGNSGGGFTALQIGAVLEGTRVVSFNPQVQIDRYVPRIAQTAHWALFGRESVADDPRQAPRMDLIERYDRIRFDQEVVLIQNPGDDHHHQEHFLPFTEAFEASGNGRLLHALTPYLGPGHRVPGVEEYLEHVRQAARMPSEREWALRGLRRPVGR